MTKPNSLATKVRFWLAVRLDPQPDAGEAWCYACSLNNRRTLLIPADGMEKHVRLHRDTEGNKFVRLKTSWPAMDAAEEAA